MGIKTFTEEYTSPIPPSRIFKASIVDSYNLIPKLMPQVIKSIEITGNGGAGSIKQINFTNGTSPMKCVKYKIDELNEETFTYGYTLLESESLVNKLEKITYEIKFEQTSDGGSVSKVTSTYYTIGDFNLEEEEVKAGKERVVAMYKAVEAYLIQNPNVYA